MTNRIQNAFDNIKADTRLKESTKQFLYDKRSGKRPVRQKQTLRYAASVICAVLIFAAGAAGYSWIRIPVSYVSIDVNPSIELGLNRYDRVVSAKAYNAEGEAILDELSLKWKRYTDALHAVLECEGMSAYLTGGEEAVLAVATDHNRGNELEKGVRHCAEHMSHNCHNVCVDLDLVSMAHQCDLSVGKYYAYLQLAAYDSSVTADDCREMSMAEIWERISGYEQAGGAGNDAGGYEEYGNEEHRNEEHGNEEYGNDDGYDENEDNENPGGCDREAYDQNSEDMPSHKGRHHRNKGHSNR